MISYADIIRKNRGMWISAQDFQIFGPKEGRRRRLSVLIFLFLQTGNAVESFEIYHLEEKLERESEKERDLTQDENNRIQKKETITQDIDNLKVFITILITNLNN